MCLRCPMAPGCLSGAIRYEMQAFVRFGLPDLLLCRAAA